jgi:hypothetical protein
MPALPPKTCFTVLGDKNFLDNRKQQLAKYSHLLLKLLNEVNIK